MPWFEKCDVISRPQLSNKLYTLLSKQKQQVVSAKCLLNFNQDFFYPESLRGLCLNLYGNYMLTEEDRLWLHPALGRATTVFNTGFDTDQIQTKLPQIKKFIQNGWHCATDMNKGQGDQSAGIYVYRNIDEYAVTVEDYRLVIEHIPSFDPPEMSGKLSDWIDKYIKLVRSYDTLATVTNMAKRLFPEATVMSHKNTNTFFKSNESYVYVNYAWKIAAQENTVHLKLHPSLGFSTYEVEKHTVPIICPSTIGYEESVTTWEQMDSRRRKHIQSTLAWTNETLPFHRHIQRSAVKKTARVDAYIANLGFHRGNIMYSKSVICGSSDAPYTPIEVTKLTESQSVAFTTDDLMHVIMKNHKRVKDELGIDIFNSTYINDTSDAFTFSPAILAILCQE